MLGCNKINYWLKLLHWIIDQWPSLISRVWHISFLLCQSRFSCTQRCLPQDQRRHLSWWEFASSLSCESSPTIGFDQCDPAATFVFNKPPIPFDQQSPENLQNRKGRQLPCLRPIMGGRLKKTFFRINQIYGTINFSFPVSFALLLNFLSNSCLQSSQKWTNFVII